MFRKFFIIFILSALFCIPLSFCLAQQEVESISCDQIITSADMPRTVVKFFMKQDKMRIESEVKGKHMVIIKNGNSMVHYYPEENMAMAMPLSEEALDKMDFSGYGKDPIKFKEYIKKMNMVKIGKDSIDGWPCDIYRFSDKEGKTQVWVTQDYNLPIKSVISSSQGDTVVEMKNLRVNENIDDSIFSLPAGVKMMDMSAMMQGMQKVMQDPETQKKMREYMNKYKNR